MMKHILPLWHVVLLSAGMAFTSFHCTEPAAANNVTVDTQEIDPELQKQWEQLRAIVGRKDFKALASISFDTLIICEEPMSTQAFIEHCAPKLFDSTFVPKMANPLYSTSGTGLTSVAIPVSARKEAIYEKPLNDKTLKSPKVFQFQVKLDPASEDDLRAISFDFIKTASGYRYLGSDAFGGPKFCR